MISKLLSVLWGTFETTQAPAYFICQSALLRGVGRYLGSQLMPCTMHRVVQDGQLGYVANGTFVADNNEEQSLIT